MNLKEAIALYHTKLRNYYDANESASITELVIENVSGLNRNDRHTKKNFSFTENQTTLLVTILERLMGHEPVQYVLNEAWFCGLKFYVDKNVLIPRPETEELVEWIISGCKFPVDELSILDVGTGSGCIPITLKRRIRKAMVFAIEKSTEAIRVAEKNAADLGVAVHFYEMDFLDSTQTSTLDKYDLIVSNPPYIPIKDRPTLATHVAEYEPGSALFVPADDPVVFYKALAAFGKNHLNKEGKIYAEMHEDYSDEVEKAFNSNGFQTEVKKDMQGKKRMIKAFSATD